MNGPIKALKSAEARMRQCNFSNGKELLELIDEYLTINSDKPMGSFKGRRSYPEVPDQIEGNDKINLNRPIGLLKGRIQLA